MDREETNGFIGDWKFHEMGREGGEKEGNREKASWGGVPDTGNRPDGINVDILKEGEKGEVKSSGTKSSK